MERVDPWHTSRWSKHYLKSSPSTTETYATHHVSIYCTGEDKNGPAFLLSAGFSPGHDYSRTKVRYSDIDGGPIEPEDSGGDTIHVTVTLP